MQTLEPLLPEPSLMSWARSARPVRLVWPLRHETAAPQVANAVSDRLVAIDRHSEPRLDDALFGSASLALVAIVAVAVLVV